ncbi:hypothetical protein Droror1_Dr00004449 [Drosera rotundifolia]
MITTCQRRTEDSGQCPPALRAVLAVGDGGPITGLGQRLRLEGLDTPSSELNELYETATEVINFASKITTLVNVLLQALCWFLEMAADYRS